MQETVCPVCNIPTDAEVFDDANVVEFPEKGQQVVLATFQLHPQYCGTLENFSQFTDYQALVAGGIATPGLEWLILRNGQPLFPYIKLELIVNPWGWNNYPVSIRLDENAKIEFIVRNRSYDKVKSGIITKVGGRIFGRYWYNRIFGGQDKSAECDTHLPGVERLF